MSFGDKPTNVRKASLWLRTVEEGGLGHRQHHQGGEVGGEAMRDCRSGNERGIL